MNNEALIGFSALVVTVVGIVIQALTWFRSPKLVITYRNRSPFKQMSGVANSTILQQGTEISPGYWVRVQVKNTGQKTAENIIGKLTEIRNSNGSLRFLTKPLELAWSQEYPLYALRPGETAILDILVATSKGKISFRTNTNVPDTERILDRETYYFVVRVHAHDAKPAQKLFIVHWRGDDSADLQVRSLGWIGRFILISRIVLTTSS